MMNDTSLAAVTTSEGDRHVIFQDGQRRIRFAFYTQSTKSWASSSDYVIATDARNLTLISEQSYLDNSSVPVQDVVSFCPSFCHKDHFD